MNRNIRENHPKNYLVLVLLIYLVAGISILKYYRYQINPDGISYISIAQKYLHGDFGNAVNGYWGPFLSWLLVPFLCLVSDGLLAGKILALFTAVASFIGLRALSYRFEMPESARTTILLASVPVILSFAFYCLTPDLLLTTILLFYFSVIFSPEYADRVKKGVLCGALGGIGYLAKSFAFPFFIFHFFVINVFHYFRSETKQAKRNVVRNFLAGAAVFVVISGVWIGLISNKYGELTFGTSGKTAYRAVTAEGSRGLVRWQGFLEPPNATAISAWEDPSYLESPPREPLDRWSFVKNRIKLTMGLVGEIASIFMGFSLLSIVICIAYVLFWMKKFSKTTIGTLPAEVLYPTVTIALYAGGYSLVWVQPRYLWVLCIMLMLMGGYTLGRLFENNFFTRTRRAALLIIFFLLFALPAVQDLKAYANRGKRIYDLSKVLKSRITSDYRIASDTNWVPTLHLSYHLECKYYGIPKKNVGMIQLKRDLDEYGIDYYFVWRGAAGDFRFLTNYQEITGGKIPGLKIYGLKQHR